MTTPIDEVKKQPLQTKDKSDVPKLSQTELETPVCSRCHGLMAPPRGSEPEFDVNVKLADLQADPNNALFSVKFFDQR